MWSLTSRAPRERRSCPPSWQRRCCDRTEKRSVDARRYHSTGTASASTSTSESESEPQRDDARGRVDRRCSCPFCSSGSKNTRPTCGERDGRRASARGTGSRWRLSSSSTTTTTYASGCCCCRLASGSRRECDVERRDTRDNALVHDRDHDDRSDRRGGQIGGHCCDRAMTSDDGSCCSLDRRFFCLFLAA